MAPSPHQRPDGREDDLVDVSHGPALGVIVGLVIVLGLWFAVIVLAMVIS